MNIKRFPNMTYIDKPWPVECNLLTGTIVPGRKWLDVPLRNIPRLFGDGVTSLLETQNIFKCSLTLKVQDLQLLSDIEITEMGYEQIAIHAQPSDLFNHYILAVAQELLLNPGEKRISLYVHEDGLFWESIPRSF